VVRLAEDLNGCFHAQAGGIGYFEAQFASIALGKERQRAKKEKSCKSLHEESARCRRRYRPQLNIPFPAVLFSLFSILLPSSSTIDKYFEQKRATGNIYNEANAHRSDGFDWDPFPG
jgi:hypothetical protein